MAKTVMMTFWNTPNLNVCINQKTIPNVDHTKFLGITLDRQLSWTPHIDMLHTKLTANKLLLHKSKRLIGKMGLKAIYYGHIHSHLIYGLVNWGSMISKSQLSKLQTAQNRCVSILDKDNTKTLEEKYKDQRILTVD